ncbi:MAG: sugar transferase [Candidatus Izemoplasmatales bacterium]|jgi:O-antigen biosynthesis protein WbqP
MDFIISFIGVIVLLPVFIIISILIKITSKGPVLFKQKRVGIRKKLFTIYKFRTMRIDTPRNIPTHLLDNPEKYITNIGKFLRKTSLDEIPQIFNILFGKMSIIGPRPALWNQYDLILERDKYDVHKVRPGLSGLAQVSGRDTLSIPDKARLDGEYVAKQNLLLDISIFLKTIKNILVSDSVVEGGTGTITKQREEMSTQFKENS